MRARLFAVVFAGFVLPLSPALADSRMEKTLRLEPGGRFSLLTDMGKVTVTGTASPGVKLVVTSRRRDLDELLTFAFREDPGSVAVTAKRRRRHLFPWNEGGGAVHFEVQVPAQTALDIDTSGGGIRITNIRSEARLDTSGGPIEARDVVGDLAADTSGGGIVVERVRGDVRAETSGGGIQGRDIEGRIDAETSGGSVRLERVTGNVRAHSSGGGITAHEIGGRLEADTSGGGIEASFARGNAHGGSLETSGGGIEVKLDPSVNLRIDASGNSVRSEVPIAVEGAMSRGKLQGTLGGGGELLRLRTSGGGVRILKM